MGAVVGDGLAAILLDYQGVRRMGNGWVGLWKDVGKCVFSMG